MPKDTIDPLLRAIGTRIKRLREARDLTKSQLARKSTVDRTYLIAIERGERNLSVLHLARIARALRVTPGSLLDD